MGYKRKIWRYIPLEAEAESILPLVVGPRLGVPEPGRLLRMVRTYLRMTVKQLAKRAHIERAHIVRMEGGRVDAQWKTWSRLFAALGCHMTLRLGADGGLEKILEDQISQMAKRCAAPSGIEDGEEEIPGLELGDEEEWMETLKSQRTAEIWDEPDSSQ